MDYDRAGQENGVTGNSAPYFGPATKQHYDTSQWALTLAGPTVSETIPDLDLYQRKRGEAEPAMLKPLPSGDYLPALITILHAIPLARNTLLMESCISSDYGHDANWWSGSQIQSTGPRLVETDSTVQSNLDLINEVQRLMAFLDNTDRSYGSTEALSRLEAFGRGTEQTDVGSSDRLMSSFMFALEATAPSVSGNEAVSILLKSELLDGDKNTSSALCIESRLDVEPDQKPASLYDVLDSLVFGDDSADTSIGLPVIDRPAQVLVLKLEQPNQFLKGLDIEVPETLYVDRYLQTRQEVTGPMRRQIASHRELLEHLEKTAGEARKYANTGAKKTFNPSELLETAARAFRPPSDLEREAEAEMEDFWAQSELGLDSTTGIGIHSEPEHLTVVQELQSAHERVQKQLDGMFLPYPPFVCLTRSRLGDAKESRLGDSSRSVCHFHETFRRTRA